MTVAENTSVPSDSQPPNAVRDIIVVSAAALILVAVGFWWNRSSSTSTPSTDLTMPFVFRTQIYDKLVGDRACRECHPGEFAQHAASGHSRTLRLAAETDVARILNGRSAADPDQPGVTWKYVLQDGALQANRVEGSKIESHLLEYAFGSNHHATTFITLSDRTPLKAQGVEHRLTYFATTDRLDTTPGQVTDSDIQAQKLTRDGHLLNETDLAKCFGCHTTVLSDQSETKLDPTTAKLAIGCERCHGPGRKHVEDARRNADDLRMPMGPGRSRPIDEIRLCGTCHRLPEMAPKGSLRPENGELARFQPVGLLLSKCFTGSQGQLSCSTCHNPHRRPSTDRVRYESICLSCHQGPASTPCPVDPKQGCVDCHMPRNNAGQNIQFTNHWIRVVEDPTQARRLPKRTQP